MQTQTLSSKNNKGLHQSQLVSCAAVLHGTKKTYVGLLLSQLIQCWHKRDWVKALPSWNHTWRAGKFLKIIYKYGRPWFEHIYKYVYSLNIIYKWDMSVAIFDYQKVSWTEVFTTVNPRISNRCWVCSCEKIHMIHKGEKNTLGDYSPYKKHQKKQTLTVRSC